MWVVKDENATVLKVFECKPYRIVPDKIGSYQEPGFWQANKDHYIEISCDNFPDITWQNEPIEIGVHKI